MASSMLLARATCKSSGSIASATAPRRGASFVGAGSDRSRPRRRRLWPADAWCPPRSKTPGRSREPRRAPTRRRRSSGPPRPAGRPRPSRPRPAPCSRATTSPPRTKSRSSGSPSGPPESRLPPRCRRSPRRSPARDSRRRQTPPPPRSPRRRRCRRGCHRRCRPTPTLAGWDGRGGRAGSLIVRRFATDHDVPVIYFKKGESTAGDRSPADRRCDNPGRGRQGGAGRDRPGEGSGVAVVASSNSSRCCAPTTAVGGRVRDTEPTWSVEALNNTSLNVTGHASPRGWTCPAELDFGRRWWTQRWSHDWRKGGPMTAAGLPVNWSHARGGWHLA